jgi:hypothetical protein
MNIKITWIRVVSKNYLGWPVALGFFIRRYKPRVGMQEVIEEKWKVFQKGIEERNVNYRIELRKRTFNEYSNKKREIQRNLRCKYFELYALNLANARLVVEDGDLQGYARLQSFLRHDNLSTRNTSITNPLQPSLLLSFHYG